MVHPSTAGKAPRFLLKTQEYVFDNAAYLNGVRS
jgi:hypothetical protein